MPRPRGRRCGCGRRSGSASPARRCRTTWASCGRSSTSSRTASSAAPRTSAAATVRRSRSMATPVRQAALHRGGRPFLLRRTKEQVVTELPPTTEITEPVEMEPAQRAVYEAIRLSTHAKVKAAIAEKGLARSGIIILDALLKLRQACCDPRLLTIKSAQKAGSAKLERLLELLGVLL